MSTSNNKLGIGYNMLHDLIVLYERFGDKEFNMKDIVDLPLKFYNKKELLSKMYKLNLVDKRPDEKDKRVKYYRLNLSYEEYRTLKEYFDLLNVYREIKIKLNQSYSQLPFRIKDNIIRLKLMT